MKLKARIQMFCYCYGLFWNNLRREIRDMPHNTHREKLEAMLFFFFMACVCHIFILAPVFILVSGALWLLSWVSIHSVRILSVLVIAWIIIDEIRMYLNSSRKSQSMAAQVLTAENYADFLVCPVLHNFYRRKIDRDILIYTGPLLLGTGYYYSLPENLTDEVERKTLQKKLVRKYAELQHQDIREVVNRNIIHVTGTFIFIAN